MHNDTFGAYLRFLSEYRVGNLAGQVEALRDMHQHGTSIPELAAITGLTEIFLKSIVRTTGGTQ
jgi:hypothetical protein